MSNILSYDGKLMAVLNKAGEIILLNAVFLLCCLPVVTIGPALASLYYAAMKSIRRERGYPVTEFWRSMKRTLKKGIPVTVISFLAIGGLGLGGRYAADSAIRLMYDFLLLIGVCWLMYLFPVMSRFEMKLSGLAKLSFIMSIRFLPITVLLLAGTVGVGLAQIYLLPIPCILFVPALWCFLVTFPMERALRAYMPKAAPGEERWYDEKQDERTRKGARKWREK